MRLPFAKVTLFVVLASLAGSAIYRIFGIERRVSDTIASERLRLEVKDRVPFTRTELSPHDSDYVEIIQTTREVRALAEFDGSYYAATGGGLIQLSPDGETLRHYTVLDGLPESDLTALIAFDGKLYIGTRSKGLVVFDGESFCLYTFTDRQIQAITCFAGDNGRLLIGTFNGGLFDFDGKFFTEVKAEGGRIMGVNCLKSDGRRLYAGTFNLGLYIYANGTWAHYSMAGGLPSDRVVGVESLNDLTWVATDLGLAVFGNDRFQTVATIPSLSGSAVFDGRLYVTKDSGEVSVFDRSLKTVLPAAGAGQARLVTLNQNLWLVSNQGVSLFDGNRLRGFGAADASLTDNFASGLAIDANGDLWVGTFRHGIDVYTPESGRIKHIESESVREINYLVASDRGVEAATSAGRIGFGGDMSVTVLTAGLPASSVNHFSKQLIATARGLVLDGGDGAHVLTTVHGLPSNSVYSTLESDTRLFAGTLGGLAEIQGGRVTRTFTSANSNLTTNWVTSLCMADGRLFIGTYGGGAFELSPSGEVRSFESETGKFTANPNAIYADDERLYIGTLTGVEVLDLRDQKWKTVRKILPSEVVMSITGDDENIYFGTSAGVARVAKRYFVQL